MLAAIGVIASSLIVVPPAENLFTFPNDFTNAIWTKAELSVTGNVGNNSSGVATADRLTPSTNNSDHWVNQSVVTVAASVYKCTFEFKTAGYDFAMVLILNSGFAPISRVVANIDSGAITDSSTGTQTYAITSKGNGWFELESNFTASDATTYVFVSIVGDGAGSGTFAGDGTSSIDIAEGRISTI